MSHTCQETGRVTNKESNRLMVQIRRATACHSCDAKGVCEAFGGKTEDVEIPVFTTEPAEIGDEVVLELPESSVIKASAALYLIPAAGLVVGALAGAHFIPQELFDVDTGTLLGALSGLTIGYLGARLFSRKMAKNPKYHPTLVKVIPNSTTDSKH